MEVKSLETEIRIRYKVARVNLNVTYNNLHGKFEYWPYPTSLCVIMEKTTFILLMD